MFTVKPMRKITLRDIAKEAGVSTTAVSLAMKGSKRVSPAKRSQILDLANQMGYRRDPMMGALCAYRDTRKPRASNVNISFLQYGDKPVSLRSEGVFEETIWENALIESKRLGYSLSKTWAGNPSLNPNRLKNILASRGVAGLVIYQANCPLTNLKPIMSDFSLIWLGDGPKGAHLNSVRINRFSSMKMAWENLSKMGYRTGGLVLAEHSVDQNYGEWEAAHNHFQRQFTKETQFIPPLTFKTNEACELKALTSWLKNWKPQVVVSAFRKIHDLLAEAGYDMPGDIGFLSLSTESGSPVSGIDQQTASIAETGIRLLDRLICNREQGIPEHQQIIETEGLWNPGNTLRQQA